MPFQGYSDKFHRGLIEQIADKQECRLLGTSEEEEPKHHGQVLAFYLHQHG